MYVAFTFSLLTYNDNVNGLTPQIDIFIIVEMHRLVPHWPKSLLIWKIPIATDDDNVDNSDNSNDSNDNDNKHVEYIGFVKFLIHIISPLLGILSVDKPFKYILI